MNNTVCNKIALALDNVTHLNEIRTLILSTMQWIGIYKIGLEQFIRFGPPILEEVKKNEKKIFLDLKLHDIPNTVAKAVDVACDYGIDFLTIHTQGGSEMIRAAMTAKLNHQGMHLPKIIGVTVLTSIDQTILENEFHIYDSIENQVTRLAHLAVASNMDGIVCSAAELAFVKSILPEGFEIITPGIRPVGTTTNDQKRVATPASAIKAGATIVVLGRAITAADNPAVAAKNIFNEIASIIQ